MNLIDVQVSNITKIEFGLPYNSVRITADFSDDGGKKLQVTDIISCEQLIQILKTGEIQR